MFLCCSLSFAAAPECRAGRRPWLPILELGAINAVSTLFLLFRGLDLMAKEGYGAIGYPVTIGTCIVGFEVYSAIRLRERPNFYSAACILSGLAGIILLALPM